jgi:hypothetical protein
MSKNVVEQVKEDAERLLSIINAEPPPNYNDFERGTHKWRGTVKHASMLLTRSLAELRRTEVRLWCVRESE